MTPCKNQLKIRIIIPLFGPQETRSVRTLPTLLQQPCRTSVSCISATSISQSMELHIIQANSNSRSQKIPMGPYVILCYT
jgi:hypothetical protein